MVNKYEVYRRAGAMNMVEEDGKLWMALLNRNGICEVDMAKKTGRICRTFEGEPLFQDYLYSHVKKVKDYLIFAPAMAEKIAIYNVKDESMIYIPLKPLERESKVSKGEAKFWNIIQRQSELYLLGYSYPAIVKINIDSMDVIYITDWVETIEEYVVQGDNCGYFSDGCIFYKEQILIPVGCMNAVLKLNLNSGGTELLKLPVSMKGIGGIASTDGEYAWLVGKGEKTNRVAGWNIRTNEIKEYCIGDMDENIFDPFCAPVCTSSKVFLFPISADYVYEIDVNTEKISKNKIIKIPSVSGVSLWPWWKTMAQRASGDILSFVTCDDFKWHEYNTLTEEEKIFSIHIEDNTEEIEKYFNITYSGHQKNRMAVTESKIPMKYFMEQVLKDDKNLKTKNIIPFGEKIYGRIKL